jgi:cytochrome b561/polyisoprenoid-binding protein YceI
MIKAEHRKLETKMPLSNTAQSYGSVTKLLHWLTALLILMIAPLGMIAHDLPYGTDAELAQKAFLFSLHKTLGVAVFFVALVRILWALGQVKPGALTAPRSAQGMIASLVHWLLYISLVAVPLAGWVHHAATSGFAPIWWPFGQDLPLVPKSESLAALTAILHGLFSQIMIVSIALHVAGAVKHHLIDKDATLRRMWFGKTTAAGLGGAHGSWGAPLAALAIFALAGGIGAAVGQVQSQDTAAPAHIALEQVSADWTVTDGQISLGITQLGSNVQGSFADWTAAINFDPAITTGKAGDVTTTIAIGSLTLGSVTAQAMGPDFFDTGSFPTATFTGDIIADGAGYRAEGTLTIKDTALPLSFPFALTVTDQTAQMQANLTLDRRDFGIGATLGDESSLAFAVAVTLEVTATR